MKLLINTLNKHSHTIKKILPIIFYILIVAFIVVYINSIDFNKITNVQINWIVLGVAVLIGLLARYWNALIWITLLHTLGAKNLRFHIRELLYVYAKSWLGRYIPGTAPWILGKIYFASKLGISKNKLAVGSLLEAALQILVFIALSLVLLVSDSRLNEIRDQYMPLLIAAIVLCIIAVLPPVFNYVMSLAYRLVKRKQMQEADKASSKTVYRGIGLFVISSFINGLVLFLIAKSIDPTITTSDLFYIMGAGNLAAAIGMLAFFAPSGIGVRESIQLLLLSVVISPAYALVIVIMSRIVEVACDFLFYIFGLLIRRTSK